MLLKQTTKYEHRLFNKLKEHNRIMKNINILRVLIACIGEVQLVFLHREIQSKVQQLAPRVEADTRPATLTRDIQTTVRLVITSKVNSCNIYELLKSNKK